MPGTRAWETLLCAARRANRSGSERVNPRGPATRDQVRGSLSFKEVVGFRSGQNHCIWVFGPAGKMGDLRRAGGLIAQPKQARNRLMTRALAMSIKKPETSGTTMKAR